MDYAAATIVLRSQDKDDPSISHCTIVTGLTSCTVTQDSPFKSALHLEFNALQSPSEILNYFIFEFVLFKWSPMRQRNMHGDLNPEPTHGPLSHHLPDSRERVLGNPMPPFYNSGSFPASPPGPHSLTLQPSTQNKTRVMLVGRGPHSSCPSLPSEAWAGDMGRVSVIRCVLQYLEKVQGDGHFVLGWQCHSLFDGGKLPLHNWSRYQTCICLEVQSQGAIWSTMAVMVVNRKQRLTFLPPLASHIFILETKIM